MKNWIQEAIFYQIYPLGFCNSPKFNQTAITHSINKIETWIPHLKRLHVNALYLGPVFESYEHGYDTSDYQTIDHRLGTNFDFKKVCEKLHEAGIRIVLDGVFHHVGRTFWAFQDVQENLQNSRYTQWFYNLNFSSQSPLHDPFTYEAWEGHYNLVKLNLQNKEVVNYIFDSIRLWIEEFDIDGIRLDAANCIDHDFFRQLKVFCKDKKADFWLMGEVIHGDYTTWANHEMLDSVTNYECYKGMYSSFNEKNFFEIAHSLHRQFGEDGRYNHLTLYNFVDNHDVDRLASIIINEADIPNIYTLLYTIPGIPSIYYGSEWAIKGKKHNGSDAAIRPSITLKDMELQHPEVMHHLCKLGAIKAQYKALSYGTYEQILIHNEQFIFSRSYRDEIIYIAFNLSNAPFSYALPACSTPLKDCIHDVTFLVNKQTCLLTMQPKSSYILIPAAKATPLQRNAQEKQAQIDDNLIAMKEPKTINQQHALPVSCNPIQIGRYRHFKGKHYAVLYVATHSETMEPYVVYRQLYDSGDVWIRPLAMFLETVDIDGEHIARFTYIGK